jgi:2-polyprenyl-3-methyl-5-hydroxy-6-metoxy-1,4-benzoquinol methylase
MSPIAFLKIAWRNRLLRRERAIWDSRWRTPNYRPRWLADAPRPFIVAGVESGRFAPGMTLLEIGCGLGTAAAWLAERGLRVTALDISDHVIAQAQKIHANQPRVEFHAADVCIATNLRTPFDIVIDTGCLQHIPANLRDGYVANVLTWTRPGSRFVLTIHKTNCTAADRLAEVQALFGQHFTLEQTTEEPPANADTAKHLNSVFHFLRSM